jgi:hypothetical protein
MDTVEVHRRWLVPPWVDPGDLVGAAVWSHGRCIGIAAAVTVVGAEVWCELIPDPSLSTIAG